MKSKNAKLVDELGELDKEQKRIKNILDKGKAELKDTDETLIEGSKYKAVISTRTSTEFNEDKCLKVVQDNSIHWLIKPSVDLKALEDAIVGGEIDVELFKDCISESTTKAITFKEVKK